MNKWLKTEKLIQKHSLLLPSNAIIEESEEKNKFADAMFMTDQLFRLSGNVAILPMLLLYEIPKKKYEKSGKAISLAATALRKINHGHQKTKQKENIMKFIKKRIRLEKMKKGRNLKMIKKKLEEDQWEFISENEIKEAKKYEDEFVII